MQPIGRIQLGKQGVTDNFIETLKNNFKKYKNVKIAVLKSAGHEREKVKRFSEEVLGKLGDNYSGRVIGFTIILKKLRKFK